MTPDHRAKLEQVAREWLIGSGFCHRNFDGQLTPEQIDVTALADLLASRDVAMLEEVRQYAAACEKVETERSSILTAHKIAYWCEKQAKERRP